MVRLLLDAPLDLPPEARAELDQQAAAGGMSQRGLATAYALFLGLAPAMLIMGVRAPALFAVTTAFSVAAFGVALWAQRRALDAWIARALYVLSSLFIGFSSGFMGPFILVPSMVGANMLAFVVFGERRDRAFYVGVGLAALLVPVALELGGLCPSSYLFSDAGMTVVPQVAAFPRLPTLVFLLVANLTMVITPALLIARIRDALSRNEERLFAYAWRLRQLLPIEARTAALPTGAAPAPQRHGEACVADIYDRLRLRRPA